MQVKVAPEYQDRFIRALDRLGVSEDERIMLAVSGGPDSLALLLLASQCVDRRFTVATVDHQLRTEAADEARFVASLCRRLDIPHITLLPTAKIVGNIQSAARATRYSLLAKAADEHEFSLIATAHHADDQLETLLMRLARGSGVNGMAGIRARNGRIIRPLLGFSKTELEDICTSADIQPVRDSSNDNTDFDRVAMRKWLELNKHPFDIVATNRTASALDDAVIALDWMANLLAAERITTDANTVFFNYKDLPNEMQRRLLLMALQRIDPDLAPRGEAIGQLLTDLHAGKTTTIGDILCKGGNLWHFAPAPPRRTHR